MARCMVYCYESVEKARDGLRYLIYISYGQDINISLFNRSFVVKRCSEPVNYIAVDILDNNDKIVFRVHKRLDDESC